MGTDDNSIRVLAVAYSRQEMKALPEGIRRGLDDRENVEGRLRRAGLTL